jgi:hypothetical protein
MNYETKRKQLKASDKVYLQSQPDITPAQSGADSPRPTYLSRSVGFLRRRLHLTKPLDNKNLNHADFNTSNKRVRSNIRHAPFLPYVDRLSPATEYPPRHQLPAFIDFNIEVMRNWMNTCKAVHGDHCEPLPPFPTGAQWFVNVRKSCIESASPIAEYAALSYVWGRTERQFGRSCLNLHNCGQLQEPGALDEDEFQLSPAIRQAMQLARDLALQYLWVDKLCIVQDGEITKDEQLDAMAAIYAGSSLTIIAAFGHDEDDGLLNITPEEQAQSLLSNSNVRDKNDTKGGSKTFANSKANLRQPRQFTSWSHLDIMTWQCQRLVMSNWYSRGWTLQENLFARRKIIFHDNTMNWECHCTSWQEGQGILDKSTQTRCARSPPMEGSMLNSGPFPDLHRFARLLSIYNQRALSFRKDAINAFSGALFDLGKAFPGGFISGVPVLFFDAMLIWQPYPPLTRRTVEHDEMSDDSLLPSWSWVGWQGDIDSESLRSASSYLRNTPGEFARYDPLKWYPSSWYTIPTVKWFHTLHIHQHETHQVCERNCKPRQPILQLPGANALQIAQESDFIPPDGWGKQWCSKTKMFFYKHANAGEQEFWCPIPLQPEPTHITEPVNRSRFLYCRTRRAFLKGRELFNQTIASKCTCVELERMDNAAWAGILRLNQNLRGKSMKMAFDPHHIYELIELSRGTVRNQPTEEASFDEWDRPGCRRSNAVGGYEFYNVMWIKRVEDVAYREAIGRVEKSVWEEVATEYVEMTLG